MKPSACCIVAALICIGPAISAQVRNNSAQTDSSDSSRGASPGEAPNSVPKAPIYTPEQLSGMPVSQPSSVNPIPSPSPAITQQTPARPNAVAAQPNAPGAETCAGVDQRPRNDVQFPGVSTSQFQRAGVSADAFTRPGVSTQQLSVLTPGGGPRPCQPRGDVVLYPEPARQPRPSPSATVEP